LFAVILFRARYFAREHDIEAFVREIVECYTETLASRREEGRVP